MVSVHPHWRGEHVYIPPETNVYVGSSPLAWGTSFPLLMNTAFFRFIPTGVGNITYSPKFNGLYSVHPHWRGEHLSPCFELVLFSGSSPLAWGTLINTNILHCHCRFIPTGVGNIMALIAADTVCTVHPHWRGEHSSKSKNNLVVYGSSPLAWGTSVLCCHPSIVGRFIPTGVGNIRI